jgi:cytoplasmic iron level regulating protein YaaA (DUF328/UPF0246 family)
MLILLSPAKTLDMSPVSTGLESTLPRLMEDSQLILKELQALSPEDIASLMDLSEKLSLLNYERFQELAWPFKDQLSKEALLAFKGDVYLGLDAVSLCQQDLAWAQDHVRLLSGFYGLLRPLDLMMAYRLEMGTQLKNPRGKDLYQFWGNRILQLVDTDAQAIGAQAVINLASVEYSKAVDGAKLSLPWVNIHFKEQKLGQLKVIGIMAKKARGRMTRWIIEEKITVPEALKSYTWDGYQYQSNLSTDRDWVFVR